MVKHKRAFLRGFTIIELLVTIVIIGILAGLVTVSFSSITSKTKQKTLENTLLDTAGKIKDYAAKNNKMPNSLSEVNVASPNDITLTYDKWAFPYFCLKGETSNTTLYIGGLLNSPQTQGCGSITNIQAITKDKCPSDGKIQVKDARDNHSYLIQKLADNQCWMLTNLAYASGGTNTYNDVIPTGTGTPGANRTGTLSNGTSDTATTITLAKYYIPPGANPTTEPTNPSTATDGGAAEAGRQYGYLYNWCAAMGSQNTSACANASTPTPDANITICPAGWRLPTGTSEGEFKALNDAINGGLTNTDAGLIATPALFQRSGSWSRSFGNQGTYGYYWSSSQFSAVGAYYLTIYSTGVLPDMFNLKNYGLAVRCIAV